MPRRTALAFISILAAVGVLVCSSTLAQAGANAGHKIAIHVVPHGNACKSIPVFTDCSQIVTTCPDSGDIDVIPVFYGLSEYAGVEFGLTWPAEWGSCAYTVCASGLNIGTIANPGEGIATAWATCQSSWFVCHGYGWLCATGPGRVSVIPNPSTGSYGTADCGGEASRSYDWPESVYCAGVGGMSGEDPCGTGGRDSGGGEEEGPLPALRIARVIEVTDGTTEYMQPIWSPDGEKLAFTKSGFTGIYLRNADGSGPIRELTSGEYSGYKPVWTSDSKGVVIRTRTGIVGQSICYIDVETGEVKVLVEHAAHPHQPERNFYGDVTIDLDGERKVLDNLTGTLKVLDGYYSGERPASEDVRLEMDYGTRRMWIVKGGGLMRAEFPYEVTLPILSPTGDKVLFRHTDGNRYVASLDGSSMTNLGQGARWNWSPDARQLVYVGAIQDNGMNVIAADLFVASADGSRAIQLTHTTDQVEDYPVWSPDGGRIAYSIESTGKICVAVLEETR